MVFRTCAFAALLVVACAVAFAPAYDAGITNWDDQRYLSEPLAQRPSLAAFTTFAFGNYHPLTMWSYAVEPKNSLLLHATNVVLHGATAVLVMILLQQLTGSVHAAFAGALLWAVHPLRVESVVWIAERKDVLFGLFYVGALIAYVKHVRGRRGALIVAFFLFLLSLLSKVMAISLPLAMLSIDFLERRPIDRKSLLEKIPFFAASIIFGAVGYAAQRSPGALPELPGFVFSPIDRIALSCRALLLYLGKLLLPVRLSAFYPYPNAITVIDWIAPLFIVVIAGLAAVTMRATRVIAFAFLFFVVTIGIVLPVISIGRTLAADRYMYIPSLGFAYAIAALVNQAKKFLMVIVMIAGLLGVATFLRSRVWHDSVALWSSVIEADPEIALAYNSRAVALAETGNISGAIGDFNTAIALDPCYGTALRNRAIVAARIGDRASAQRDLDRLRHCSR